MPKPYPKEEGSLVGYARVSTLDQNLDLQIDALKRAGCIKVFTDRASGAVAARPGLEEVMNFLREGDTLVVWKLDRLGRSIQNMITLVEDLKKRKVKFRSLSESIDTDTAAGRAFLNIIVTFAEYERSLAIERTEAGLAAARACGRVGGRKPVLNKTQIDQAKAMLAAGSKVIEVCRTLDCSPRTLRRRMAEIAEAERKVAAGSRKPKRKTPPAQSQRLATSHPPSGAHRHV